MNFDDYSRIVAEDDSNLTLGKSSKGLRVKVGFKWKLLKANDYPYPCRQGTLRVSKSKPPCKIKIKTVSPSGGFRPIDLNFEKQDLHVFLIKPSLQKVTTRHGLGWCYRLNAIVEIKHTCKWAKSMSQYSRFIYTSHFYQKDFIQCLRKVITRDDMQMLIINWYIEQIVVIPNNSLYL